MAASCGGRSGAIGTGALGASTTPALVCVDAQLHPLSGACGTDRICRDAAGNPIAGSQCVNATLVCVNSMGTVVTTATCGEDHQCRDASGSLVEGLTCVAKVANACHDDDDEHEACESDDHDRDHDQDHRVDHDRDRDHDRDHDGDRH